jgi:NTE family protein
VGAAYIAGRLDALEKWVRTITRLDIVRLMDLTAGRGGFISGARVFDQLRNGAPDPRIEDLEKTFAAVATDIETGREVWLREGSLQEAVRASVSVPGLFAPYRYGDRWLVDGGLVNPVPVSVCRALGADVVIAVADLGGRGDERA